MNDSVSFVCVCMGCIVCMFVAVCLPARANGKRWAYYVCLH